VAVVVASAIKPMMDWLTRRGISRTLAALGIYLATLTLIVGFAVLVFPIVLDQLPPIAARLGGVYQGVRERLLASQSEIVARVATDLPPTLPGESGGAPATVALGLSALGSLLRGVFLFIAVPVFAFLWTVDGARAVRKVLRLLPAPRRRAVHELIIAAEQKTGAFVRGQAIVCASVGAITFPAYVAIGVPHALALAVVAAVLEALSYPGTIVSAGLAALVALTQSPVKALWVVATVVAINLAQGYLVAPRVMRGAVGVGSFVRLLSITAFGIVGGIPGVFLAIPAAAVLQLLFERIVRGHPGKAGAA
jgi:predicted PurR-regulated permease PerM